MKVIYKGEKGLEKGFMEHELYDVLEENETQFKVENYFETDWFPKEEFEIVSESTLKLLDKYPKYLIRKVRQRYGIEAEDTSKDRLILGYTRSQFFKEVAQWEGLMGSYHETIKCWIDDIYGIDLDSISDELELKEKVTI